MSGSTRRNFLIASGTGAAAVGVAAVLPAVAEAQTAAAPRLPGNAQPLVAHVGDPSSGTLSLLVGEHEVTVHDPELVARLASAAAAAAASNTGTGKTAAANTAAGNRAASTRKEA